LSFGLSASSFSREEGKFSTFGFQAEKEVLATYDCKEKNISSIKSSLNWDGFCFGLKDTPESLFAWKKWEYTAKDFRQSYIDTVMESRKKTGLSGGENFTCEEIKNFMNNFASDSRNLFCTVNLKAAPADPVKQVFFNFYFFYPQKAKDNGVSNIFVVQGSDADRVKEKMRVVQGKLTRISL
jgi:hypothetical protein